jgi:type II secretory pathway pseudopilin PulG
VILQIQRESGFSFVEVLIAVTIFAAAIMPLLFVAAGAERLARSQPEAADLQQRVRVIADKLKRDVALAGAGPLHGSLASPLGSYVAAVVPARTGVRLRDPELSAFPDRISVIYVPDGGVQASLATSMTTASAALLVDLSADGCGGSGVCGFTTGSRAMILDGRGVGAGHDVFTVTGVNAATGEVDHDAAFSRAYAAGAAIVPIIERVYHFDPPNRRLMQYDGDQSDMPLVDNVVDLNFTYFGDPSPASVARPPAGESSCVYEAGFPPVPRLAPLGGSGLRRLPLAQLMDGPICGLSPNAFDGDLLRIRMVRVTLRLQAAADDVRGTGRWFSRPGRSNSGYSYVPDYEVTFDIAIRNMLPAVQGP